MTDEFRIQQERDVVRSGRLLTIAAATAAVGILGVLVAALLNPRSRSHASFQVSDAAFRPGTPERSLIERTERGLSLQAEQRATLTQYGWVDRDAGIARIPIERAIELRAGRSP